MGVGYLLLYAALAAVALWLVAELLLQNRAPVVWRGVALAGFLLVVVGMRLQSVLVIGAGAAGFALGQVLVTRSVKRGAAVGWSLRGADGSLPGPLARIPLLGAATGGAAGATGAAVPPAPLVGEVGPIEPEQPGAAYAEPEELVADGVYTDQFYGYDQQQDQQQNQYEQQQPQQQTWEYQQQSAGYGYGYATADGQAWIPQQPVQPGYQPGYQDAYGQPVQAAYPSYDPYTGQQQTWDPQAAYQQQTQQAWAYPQPVVPQQQAWDQPHQQQPQTWDYQQQG